MTAGPHAEQGSWSISIQMGDTAGNSIYISLAQLNAVGFSSTLQQTCAGDTSPPQIAGVTVTPETVDTSTGSRAVVVAVHAIDDLSGVGSLQATLSSGGQSQSASASLQSAHGQIRWEAGVAKTHFTTQIKELTKVTLETVKGAKMVCAGGTGTGEYAGLKTVRHVILSFTGCELVRGSVQCTSAGAAAGEVLGVACALRQDYEPGV